MLNPSDSDKGGHWCIVIGADGCAVAARLQSGLDPRGTVAARIVVGSDEGAGFVIKVHHRISAASSRGFDAKIGRRGECEESRILATA